MIRPSYLTLLCLISLFSPALGGEDRFVLFPDRIGFVPFRANWEEPRMGVQFTLGERQFDLAIGAGIDILQYHGLTDTLGLGTDFFGYASSRDFAEYRFKIDAADGYFGIHLSYKTSSPVTFRLRWVHFSAHLVDGYYYGQDYPDLPPPPEPIPFMRNFLELAAAFEPRLEFAETRLYVGGSHAATEPDEVQHWAGIAGIEISSRTTPTAYAAWNISLLGVPEYKFSNNVELGMKIGKWNGRGMRIYLSYYNGLNRFGQYYNEWLEKWSAGFTFDIF